MLSICPSICRMFLFPGDNFSKYQWIFMKFGVCIVIVGIWFGIADGQILSISDSYQSATCPYLHFSVIT